MLRFVGTRIIVSVSRPARTRQLRWPHPEPLEAWLAEPDDAEFLAVALGVPIGQAGHFVRHNLMVSELVLRLQEVAVAPLQAVFGERFSGTDNLFGSKVSRYPIYGDCCIVREDGLRIVVELVRRQRSTEVKKKMLKWGEILSRAPLSTLGTTVVFLNASLPGREHADRATSLRRCHSQVLSPERLSTGYTGSLYARQAIFVASAQEWFPACRSISRDFTDLSVCYRADDRTWRRGALLAGRTTNVLPFSPAQPAAWTKPGQVLLGPASAAGIGISNGPRYYAVPPWFNGPIAPAPPPGPQPVGQAA